VTDSEAYALCDPIRAGQEDGADLRMKPKIRTNQIQIELFQESEVSRVPLPPPLAADREVELKRAIGELLLSVALGDAAINGVRHDE
jgi:hypothetical protein